MTIPASSVSRPAGMSDDPHRDVDAGLGVRDRREEVEGDLVELLRREPAGGIGAHGIEGHVAEVQSPA